MSGLGLAFAIGAWWDGHPQYLAMVINVVAVFYLNQREVRSVFDTGEIHDASARARGRVVIDAADLELLRRHEPILRFTRGELFLPMPTDGYVAACDLLSGPVDPRGDRRRPGGQPDARRARRRSAIRRPATSSSSAS